MAKAVTMVDQSNMPTTGRWVWKDDNTLDFISNIPGGDRQGGKRDRRQNKQGVHFPDHGSKRNDRATPSSRAYGVPRGRQSRGPPGHRAQSSKQTTEHVTLNLVKTVAMDMMSDVEEIAPIFDLLFEKDQFDAFLSCLLNYFHFYFEKKTHEEKPNPMNIEPSAKEKRYYAELCANVEGAQKLLGSSYCILVLGIGLEGQHHMACGMSRVSNTYQDRSMYETLYTYCTFVVWIAFKRKDFESVKREISRMLRSDTFNPAIRVKNAPEPEDEGGEKKKLTPAEYRRVQGRRPPIKSIINQRSPALVSILPSPKEESNWLFKRSGGLSPTQAADSNSLAEAGRDEDEDDHLKALHMAAKGTLRLGIIGEPLSQFNQTLTPIGADNEGEEEEEADEKGGTRRQSTLTSSHNKTPQGKDVGVSREQTGVSVTTVEALPDDD